MLKNVWKPKTLVMSSGGIYGILMLGALSVLEKEDLLTDVKHYIGCSAGSIGIAGLLLGYPVSRIMDIVINLDFSDWNRELTATEGLVKAKALSDLLNCHLGDRRLKDFDARVTFSVVNLNLGKTEYIDTQTHPEIRMADAVMMSCSIPILFPAVHMNGYLYCDGGVSDPFPIDKSENLDYTLGLNCIRARKGEFVKINRGISSLLTISNILINLIRDEINELKKYDNYNVVKLHSYHEGNLNITDCTVNKKIYMYHEGLEITTQFVKILTENKLMQQEDSRGKTTAL